MKSILYYSHKNAEVSYLRLLPVKLLIENRVDSLRTFVSWRKSSSRQRSISPLLTTFVRRKIGGFLTWDCHTSSSRFLSRRRNCESIRRNDPTRPSCRRLGPGLCSPERTCPAGTTADKG